MCCAIDQYSFRSLSLMLGYGTCCRPRCVWWTTGQNYTRCRHPLKALCLIEVAARNDILHVRAVYKFSHLRSFGPSSPFMLVQLLLLKPTNFACEQPVITRRAPTLTGARDKWCQHPQLLVHRSCRPPACSLKLNRSGVNPLGGRVVSQKIHFSLNRPTMVWK